MRATWTDSRLDDLKDEVVLGEVDGSSQRALDGASSEMDATARRADRSLHHTILAASAAASSPAFVGLHRGHRSAWSPPSSEPATRLANLWAMADPELKSKVEELISANPVLLFMKGTPDMPRCGFSMRVVQTLDSIGAEYGAIDVLPALQPLREVTAEIADWQTFPQLYVKGELVGGADIVEEMYESGELADLLGVEQPEAAAPRRSAQGLPASRRRCRSNRPQPVAGRLQVKDAGSDEERTRA